MTTRTERDSMGEMEVPFDILHGASTQRAVLNFPISGRPVPASVIQAFAHLKGRDFVTPYDVQEVALPVLDVRMGGDLDSSRRNVSAAQKQGKCRPRCTG